MQLKASLRLFFSCDNVYASVHLWYSMIYLRPFLVWLSENLFFFFLPIKSPLDIIYEYKLFINVFKRKAYKLFKVLVISLNGGVAQPG